MKNLHIIMPMAGEGSRFKDRGYDVPKPLIRFNGKELYRHALDSIHESKLVRKHPELIIKHTFIVRKEFISDYHIDTQIKEVYPDANIIAVEKTTRGSLETALLAKDHLDLDNDSVMIMDSDIEFRCEEFYDELSKTLNEPIDVPLLLSFYSNDTRYSYVDCIEIDSKYYAKITAEKNPISTHALTGCYYLGDAKTFIKLSENLIKDFENKNLNAKECYVSLIYNYYIWNKYIIQVVDFNIHKDHLWSYGTPEELTNYLTTNKNIWDK